MCDCSHQSLTQSPSRPGTCHRDHPGGFTPTPLLISRSAFKHAFQFLLSRKGHEVKNFRFESRQVEKTNARPGGRGSRYTSQDARGCSLRARHKPNGETWFPRRAGGIVAGCCSRIISLLGEFGWGLGGHSAMSSCLDASVRRPTAGSQDFLLQILPLPCHPPRPTA
jgi:hypothetical protein